MNEAPKSYEFGEFRLDAVKRVLLKHDGERIALTPKAFDTLLYFVQNSGRLLDKDELLQAVWADTVVEENNLNQHISTLRRALGEKRDEHRFIVTVPGRGYRFIAEVKSGVTANEESAATPAGNEAQPAPETKVAAPVTAALRADSFKRNTRFRWVIGLVGVGLLAGLVVGVFFLWRAKLPAAAPIRTIAVLPFKPLVAEHRDEALEMGVADTLIARLGNNREVIVRPLSSVRRYSGLEQDPQTAGRELGVAAVLEGSLQKWGDRIRVNARLLRVADGASLWTGTFDEKMTGVFMVQDAIAEKVAGALALRLNEEDKQRLTRRSTENLEAYQLYLLGRYHWGQLTPSEIRKGISYFQQAIALDPAYALAYGGLAEAYRALPITSDVSSDQAVPQAKAAAAKALALDDTLGEVHATLGIVKIWYDWDWTGAEHECQRAVALNPNSGDAHRACALLRFSTGRLPEAVAAIKRAREFDPLSPINNALEGMILLYAGQDREATARLQRTLELAPNFWVAHVTLGKVYLHQKRYPEALAAFRKAREFSGDNTEAISLIGYTWAVAGNRAQAQTTLVELKAIATQRYVPPYNVAMVYNGLGEKDEALAWLEKAYAERDVRLTFIKVEPKWDAWRTTPRFVEILNRTGLAD
jgi:serine/threonine-protein kinase